VKLTTNLMKRLLLKKQLLKMQLWLPVQQPNLKVLQSIRMLEMRSSVRT